MRQRKRLERLWLTSITTWEQVAYRDLNSDDTRLKAQSTLSSDESLPSTQFWILLLTKLPTELRDLVYEYVVGYACGVYTVQTAESIVRYEPGEAIHSFHVVPKSLAQKGKRTGDEQAKFEKRVAREMTAHFFEINSFYLRYRYTENVLSFLTNPFENTDCIPIQHLQRLYIILGPPESAEDDHWYFEESEFEWHKLFPQPMNAKCQMYRDVLKADFERLADIFDRDIEVMVLVLGTEGGNTGQGLMAWLETWKKSIPNDTARLMRIKNDEIMLI